MPEDEQTAEARFAAALALHRQGQLAAAADAYSEALKLEPGLIGARINRGACLRSLGRTAEALAELRDTARRAPTVGVVHLSLSQVLSDLGSTADALAEAELAAALDPANAAAQLNLGQRLADAGRIEAAIPPITRSTSLAPQMIEAWSELANALTRADRLEEALVASERALKLSPDHADALSTYGNIERELGRFEDAFATHLRALALKPASPEIAWNFALAALTAGHYGSGWIHFDRRLECRGALVRSYAQDRWDGRAPLDRKTVFVYPELGFGDTIHFVRFAPILKQRGARRLIVEVQAPLVPLIARMPGIDQVIGPKETPPPFDFHLPLISLLPALDIRPETVLPAEGYLTAPAKERPEIAAALRRPPHDALTVGLVWSGDMSRSFGAKRSVPVLDLLEAVNIPGVAPFLLQKERSAGDAEVIRMHKSAIDLAPWLGDFDDTAWAVSQLDLVISVDTAVAHLAGALGIPVWLLLRYARDWRYPVTHEESPWYESMRLVPQTRRGDWSDALGEVREALAALAAEGG
ncbi:MAG TPA: tetratricopeptide repeat-containing glycosyltransferase family protein [Candidatus Cybelea sp.]|nr:tetratricopeptide repeat-containing glycosyltransferase family protein [Candidatus Cybelea sp.]